LRTLCISDNLDKEDWQLHLYQFIPNERSFEMIIGLLKIYLNGHITRLSVFLSHGMQSFLENHDTIGNLSSLEQGLFELVREPLARKASTY